MKQTAASAAAAAVSVRLSARGLANIQEKGEYNDFEFIVGESRYRCPWFIADFLSPRIAQLYSIDNTIRSFIIGTKDTKNEFTTFRSLGHGDEIHANDGDRDFYELLVDELENQELSGIIFETGQEEMRIKIAIRRLGHNLCLNDDCSKLIEFIVSHFEDDNFVKLREVKEMNLDIWSRILSSESLKIESEDWPYKMIWELVEIDDSYFSLLEFVQFEFVSTAIAERLIESCHDFINFLNCSIWTSLGWRFIHPISPSGSSRRLTCKGLGSRGREFYRLPNRRLTVSFHI
jgi:hypothetical protein